MLRLSRRLGEKVIIENGRIVLTVIKVRSGSVKLGFEADENILIVREELDGKFVRKKSPDGLQDDDGNGNLKTAPTFGAVELTKGIDALTTEQPVRTICNVIRQIWNSSSKDQEFTTLCAEAIWMAKRMDAKLREYRSDWDANEWQTEPGSNA